MEDFKIGLDGNLAYRMRRVNSEQFYTLVRMHLSFELDLNSEDNDQVTEKAKLKKWGILHFSKKPRTTQSTSKSSEGITLTKEVISQMKQLIEYLSQEKCLEQEGIFRRTGKLTRQQELKSEINQKLPINLEDGRYSVHDCASVLKNILAELSEPLLTDHYYPAFCQIASELCIPGNCENDARLLRSLQLLFLLLPTSNRILLRHILRLLNKTASMEHCNKMNSNTLATLFTPHLLCPRKLSPEALHTNSQNLFGLVSFMISKGEQLFEVPPKLMTDIRAFWVEQEKKLLSPKKPDPNESTSDMTAHTVFSFVDHKLTAKATASQDTQAALAQLYAHIQSMPESAKKRRLVKQFNKENGQGTPRLPKTSCKTKSLGDSIKKHIFHKKVLCNKKLPDAKFSCNFSRSSSEENMLSNTFENSLLLPKMLSKSDDELSTDSYKTPEEDKQLLSRKKLSNSTGSLNDSPGPYYDDNFYNPERCSDNIYDYCRAKNSDVDKQLLHPDLRREFHNEEFISLANSEYLSYSEKGLYGLSPQHKLRSVRDIHTSTPSNLLRQSLGCYDHIFTPILNDDNSTSPITQSATKMSRAMQETMMTPRSRKPVIMLSSSNSCNNISSLSGLQYGSNESLQNSNFDLLNQDNCALTVRESQSSPPNFVAENQENDTKISNDEIKNNLDEQSPQTDLSEKSTCPNPQEEVPKSNGTTNLNNFQEYRLSKSVLTASPVDLSFVARADDLDMDTNDQVPGLNKFDSSNTNSSNNSSEVNSSPLQRKRSTSLHRTDWKRSVKSDPQKFGGNQVPETSL